VVCGIHLLGLQIYSCSFESSQQEEMVVHWFSQGRLFLELGSAQWVIGRLSGG
jgi:hypothetical protein